MRNMIFQALYWTTSIVVALVALPMLLIPGRKLLMHWLQFYASAMVFWMRTIVGIKVEFRGLDNVPDGPCIIAAKHQSWGDGYATFSQVHDLAIVTGDHLERIPVVGFILRKMEAVVVDTCGGATSRDRLVDVELERARKSQRKILIFPEGHLAPVGYHYRYRKGVYFMYKGYECPVIPVATNLGLFWPGEEWTLTAGDAVVEFLEPIQPGLDKDEFMAVLEERIESASLALLPDGYELPKYRELEYDKETDQGYPIIPEEQQSTV